MTSYPDPDAVVDAFSLALARALSEVDGTLVRIATSHSDRSFEAVFENARVPFVAKLSQTDKSFWGLTEEKGAALDTGQGGHLVLLTSGESGYFLAAPALKRLMPQFSRTKSKAVRINENKVKGERWFDDLD